MTNYVFDYRGRVAVITLLEKDGDGIVMYMDLPAPLIDQVYPGAVLEGSYADGDVRSFVAVKVLPEVGRVYVIPEHAFLS